MAPGQGLLRKSDWWKHSQGRAMVWGEFLRFLKYGERGDILVDEEAKEKIEEVKKQASRA
jgi:hypothetical protein